jgi:hypothetical protein
MSCALTVIFIEKFGHCLFWDGAMPKFRKNFNPSLLPTNLDREHVPVLGLMAAKT